MEGVRRWLVNISVWNPSEHQFQSLLSLLPPQQQPEVTKFVKLEDRKRALVSRLLQYCVINDVLGIPFDEICILRTTEGKPYLKNRENLLYPNFNFSVSHHGDYVGVACEPICLVGFDIVSTTKLENGKTLQFLENFLPCFTTFEWDNIVHAGSLDKVLTEFYRYWSLKESYVKAIGAGLGFRLNRLEFHHDNWADIYVCIDGTKLENWRFWFFDLENKHLSCVAKGHPKEATGNYQVLLTTVGFDEEGYQHAVELPERAGKADLITTKEWGGSSQRSGERVHIHPVLYHAASGGNVALLDYLLRSEGENHVQPVETAIDVANMATTEHRTVSPLLGVTHAGNTALHIATCFGHHDMAKRICEKNSSLFMQDNDKAETPLHYAAQAGNSKLVTLFIRLAEKEGGNVVAELLRKRNRNGETALFQAIHHCQVLEVDVLRLYGKLKLLHFHFGNAKRAWADKNTHVEVVEELLRADFAVADCPNFRSMFQLASIPNNNGISPLYLAIMQNSLSTVTSLVGSLPESASRVEYAGPDGQTALHAAAVRNKGFIQKVTGWKPELTKTTDNSGSTPLHYAVSANNLEGVKLLLETDKTSAYVADDSSLYPIHVAAKLGLEQLVAEFFEQCPDSDELLDREGRNFLHLAVEERKASVVWWVCKRSKLVKVLNSQENKGDTPMHLAVKARDVNIFALLLGSQKTRTCIMNKNGLTPLDVAIANRTVGFWNWQNPNYIIERTLNWIGCSSGIHRIDNFISEHNLLMDQEKKEKEAQDLEKMAKSMAIGSTLIASAAFAGTFTVSIAYRRESNSSHTKPGLSLAFKAFVIMSAYAFICAIAATALVVEAALNFLDPEYRKKYVVICAQLVTEAIKGFIVAIALGVLVMMISVLQWRLACLICLICCVVPVLLQPHFWPNILIQRALIRYLGIKRFTLVGGHILIRNISYGIIVLLVLLAGRSSNTDLAEHIVLAIIIVILLFVSYPFIPSFGNIWIRSKAITIMVDKRFFIIIVLSLVTYMVLFFPMEEIKKSSKAT